MSPCRLRRRVASLARATRSVPVDPWRGEAGDPASSRVHCSSWPARSPHAGAPIFYARWGALGSRCPPGGRRLSLVAAGGACLADIAPGRGPDVCSRDCNRGAVTRREGDRLGCVDGRCRRWWRVVLDCGWWTNGGARPRWGAGGRAPEDVTDDGFDGRGRRPCRRSPADAAQGGPEGVFFPRRGCEEQASGEAARASANPWGGST